MPTAAPTIATPTGYTLLDRLGSGGFGEVWRATAPGGVEKAVKIVFGHCDADLAERELKSLDRIRNVRHPFILSVERYEVVDNRLVVVTELADTSLDKRYRESRAEGLAGIPRDELLRFMADAAEALDCLTETHGLQHLDVKPENLLIVGRHVKVADFGLVKELTNKTLCSMIGGMTPLYSAPEIYDGAPTAYSDQYSLAVVFQQMLTGVLPFSGRTPAQLAKQHTMMQPSLSALEGSDREAVARALSKSSGDRFGSCRDFVAALTGAAPAGGASRPTAAPVSDPPDHDTKSVLAMSTQVVGGGQRARRNRSPDPAPAAPAPRVESEPAAPRRFVEVDATVHDAESTVDAALEANRSPTLFVSVGGVGLRMLAATKASWSDGAPQRPAAAWLAIDTDRDELNAIALSGDWLDREDTLLTPLRRSKQYGDASRDLLRWVSRRWLYNIPRSLQTRGYRPLGRIAAVDNAADVVGALSDRLRRLASEAPGDEPLEVVVLSGAAGGAGSGVFIDIAQAARSITESLGARIVVRVVVGLTADATTTDPLAIANTIATLSELDHAQRHGNVGEAKHVEAAARFTSSGAPFDEVYCVTLPPKHDRQRVDAKLRAIGGYLATRSTVDLTPLAPPIENPDSPDGRASVRTLGFAQPDRLRSQWRDETLRRLSAAVFRDWFSDAAPSADARTRGCLEPFGGNGGTRFAQQFAELLAGDLPEPTFDPTFDPTEGEPDEAGGGPQAGAASRRGRGRGARDAAGPDANAVRRRR